MAKSKDPKEAAQEGKQPEPKKKAESSSGSGNKTFITMFSIVIAVQLVIIVILVYFYLTRPEPNFSQMPQQVIVDNTVSQKPEKKVSKKEDDYEEEDDDEDEEVSSSKGPVVTYETDDLIINPRGARPGKYLMTKVGFSVLSEEVKKEFEDTRKAQIYDIVNGYLASHTLEYLADIDKRDTLKIEMKQLLNKNIKGRKVKDVFFSKYIVQS